LFRVLVGQRPQEHGIDYAEHRGVRADAQSQRKHRNRRDARIRTHDPKCVGHILAHEITSNVLSNNDISGLKNLFIYIFYFAA
jgi:hypothetical protein